MSSYTPTFQGEIKDNKITITKAKRMWREWIRSLSGQKIEIIVRKWRSLRSRRQNSLMWAWLNILEQETGQSKDDLHDYFNNRYLKRTIVIKGKEYIVVRSSTSLRTDEFTEYLGKIRVKSATFFSVNLPDPYEWYSKG